MSPTTTVTSRAPTDAHSSATSSSDASPRATSTSLACRLAKARAVPRPRPLDAPVITTTGDALMGPTLGAPEKRMEALTVQDAVAGTIRAPRPSRKGCRHPYPGRRIRIPGEEEQAMSTPGSRTDTDFGFRRAKRPRSIVAGPYGHPFHATVVTIPIGAWTAAVVFDIAALLGAAPHA